MTVKFGKGGGRDLKVADDERAERPNELDGSKLCDLFGRFLSSEGEAKLANEHKAEIFAEAKNLGFDSRALRAAFRHRVREIDKPKATATHDELIDDYLAMLRGAENNGPASSSSGLSTSPGAIEPRPDVSAAPSRPRAHTRTREGSFDDPNGGLSRTTGAKEMEVVKKGPSVDDEPDIPDCLDVRKSK